MKSWAIVNVSEGAGPLEYDCFESKEAAEKANLESFKDWCADERNDMLQEFWNLWCNSWSVEQVEEEQIL